MLAKSLGHRRARISTSCYCLWWPLARVRQRLVMASPVTSRNGKEWGHLRNFERKFWPKLEEKSASAFQKYQSSKLLQIFLGLRDSEGFGDAIASPQSSLKILPYSTCIYPRAFKPPWRPMAMTPIIRRSSNVHDWKDLSGALFLMPNVTI